MKKKEFDSLSRISKKKFNSLCHIRRKGFNSWSHIQKKRFNSVSRIQKKRVQFFKSYSKKFNSLSQTKKRFNSLSYTKKKGPIVFFNGLQWYTVRPGRPQLQWFNSNAEEKKKIQTKKGPIVWVMLKRFKSFNYVKKGRCNSLCHIEKKKAFKSSSHTKNVQFFET